MPISSRMRMAPLWIASTPSGGSGSVGLSRLSGMLHGIWLMAGPLPRVLPDLPPPRLPAPRPPV